MYLELYLSYQKSTDQNEEVDDIIHKVIKNQKVIEN